MKKNKGLIISIVSIILLIIIWIFLVLSVDITAHLFSAFVFFAVASILILVPLIYVIYKYRNNRTSDQTKTKKSRIIKTILVGLIVLLWLNSGACLIIKSNITPVIMSLDERISNIISRSYTDEELYEIRNYVLVDIWEVSPISLSLLDINTINSKYPIEALKYFFGNYYVYYRSENHVLQLVFDYVGNLEYMLMMEIKGNSEDADKIKIGDKSEDVKQYFSNKTLAMEHYFYKEETYATKDEYLIIVHYKNDRVIRVDKIPI